MLFAKVGQSQTSSGALIVLALSNCVLHKCQPVLGAGRLGSMPSTTWQICSFGYLRNSLLFVDGRVFVFWQDSGYTPRMFQH